nr:MAG: hypothetical protein [uncultured cyanophage]
MNKTKIYLSRDTAVLKELKLDAYFPETELHPSEAAKLVPSLLGKSFCTHSEAIVSKIGHMIAEREIADHTEIEVYIISEDRSIHRSSYDKDGYLVNWYLGYFEWQWFLIS